MTSAPAIASTCPYCGVGCGVLARTEAAHTRIEGDPEHPANFGRLCSKGTALGETLGLDGRLLQAEIEGQPVALAAALDAVARGFAECIEQHGPDSVALYVSGQLLTEDYYAANKLMKGFVGSANIDTNSRLCMSSTVAGQLRGFGSDTVPGCYEDIELADLVILVGSNLAWCHPVLYQRLRIAKEARPQLRVVVVDPRRTPSCEIADLHLPIAADADALLFAGLLGALARVEALDRAYLRAHVEDPQAALAQATALSLAEVAARCGLSMTALQRLVGWLKASPRTVTLFSQGVNQSRRGTDKVSAILNLHLATGRIGKPGSGPFSLTGQPNAMGGREVGGLASLLAAHMRIDSAEDRVRLQRFWNAPRMAAKPGLKAVDLFHALEDGRIRALWVIGTNPAVSMPEARRVEAALARCPLLVVSEVMRDTDTARHARIRLPALAWGEKSGTVTNSERRISRQRAFLPAPGDARADWWLIAQVARRLGWGEAFGWNSAGEVFAEHAALSGLDNAGRRDFDISAWADCSAAEYEAMQPFQWPARHARSGDAARLFGEGGFFTGNGKARLLRLDLDALAEVESDPRYPLELNSGRVRDHWHTLTRTGSAPSLSQHLAEPYVELHPADARARGVQAAELVRVESRFGAVDVRALLSERVRPGQVFVPMHWNDQFASCARIGALFDETRDPHSGQPALKAGRVEVSRLPMRCFGFAVLAERPARVDADYWALARCEQGWRLELAWRADIDEVVERVREISGLSSRQALSHYADARSGQQRFACFDDDRLRAVLVLESRPVAAARQWLARALTQDFQDVQSRHRLLAARPPADVPDAGPVVCVCWQVGVHQIRDCIRKGADSVAAIGRELRAGTQCGSCRSELNELLQRCAALPDEALT